MKTIYYVIAILVIGLALGLGLGLGLKKDNDKDDNKAVQVYGNVSEKDASTGYSEEKVWVYPLYLSEQTAKNLFGADGYHYHMFENCDKKYYMSNSVSEHKHTNKSAGMDVNTCDGKLPESGSSSGGGYSGGGGYGGGYGGGEEY